MSNIRFESRKIFFYFYFSPISISTTTTQKNDIQIQILTSLWIIKIRQICVHDHITEDHSGTLACSFRKSDRSFVRLYLCWKNEIFLLLFVNYLGTV